MPDASAREQRAARVLLSLHPEAQFTGHRLAEYPHMQPLAQAFAKWLDDENPRGNWFDAVLPPVAETAVGAAAPGCACGRASHARRRKPTKSS